MADLEQQTFQLPKPISLGEITLSELTLRQPTVAQWLKWEGLDGVEADVRAVAVLSGQVEPLVAKLKAKTLNAAIRWLVQFIVIAPYVDGDEVPETFTVELSQPLDHAGEIRTSITVEEPTAADWLQWDKLKGLAGDVLAVSVMSGLPVEAVHKLLTTDFLKLTRFIGHFLD